MISCFIIDDELKGRVNIAEFIHRKCSELKIVGQAGNVREAIDLVHATRPQLLFLDIEMRDGSGFDVLKQCKDLPLEVIFVTIYNKHGLRSIQLSAIDFILKPIEEKQFLNAVENAVTQIELKQENERISNLLFNVTQNEQSKRIALPDNNSFKFVELKNIVRLEVNENYTRFFLSEGQEFKVFGNLIDYKKLLALYGFVSTNQEHLVNQNCIKSLKKRDGGYLLLQNGDRVPVSREQKDELVKVMKGN